MMWLVGPLVVVLVALAGSPWLLAHRAQRRRRLHFIKKRRSRLHGR